ncbi:MAG: magnesium transporter [Candidatus Rokubacteria bacterium RIFCSPLOWO2_02_FULL_68_19]|nr:MAG: magnesium transporter [Candidatus Rokubacteria bacterium RIFCSPLOWO2_02_FULL_68_19]
MEELFRLTEDVKDLLDTDRTERLAQLLAESHPADVSRALRELPVERQTTVFRLLSGEQAGSVLHEMDDQTLLELVRALDEVELSGILEQMPADNAAQVVDELSEEQAEKVLDLMKEEKSEEVQELLEYGEKTAGRIMSPEFVAVHEEMSVAQALDHVRKSASSEHAFYLYVVDDHDHLVGVVPLRRLITADPATPIRLIRHEDVVSVTPETDQEEAARLVAKYNLLAVPVVDGDRRLLGTVTVDDVIDVIQQEATEDIQRFGGAAGDETVLDPPRAVFTKRLVWRFINLATAILAASVIGLFEGSIRSLATLAVFMPIVASMGGIGTTQTATVVVRGIALGDMTASVLLRVLRKEVTLGLTTGAANGVVMAGIAYLWKGQLLLSLILGVALIFNMVVAAVVGTLVPLALKTFRLDPAIASSVIITTFTDVFGFFSFLGLATLLMKFLL